MSTRVSIQSYEFNQHSFAIATFDDLIGIDSADLVPILGYKDKRSLRRLIEGNWASILKKNDDYFNVTGDLLSQYEALITDRPLPPAHTTKGRLFIKPQGLKKLTSKIRTSTYTFWKKLEEINFLPSFAKPIVNQVHDDALEARKFKYDIYQKLIQQLMSTQDVRIIQLAIQAAEIGLNRSLLELRASYLAPPKYKTRPSQGPFFTEEGYYSFSEIGELAGGYSPTTAGRAADIVADRCYGHDHYTIRNVTVPYNKISKRSFTSNKNQDNWALFNKFFANLVVIELRSNPSFAPSAPANKIENFQSNALPKLSVNVIPETW